MRLVVIGVNHKTAPVALRERLALVGDDVNIALKQLEAFTDGSVIVSTCNRTEIYALVPQLAEPQDVPSMSANGAVGAQTSSAAISAHILKIKAWLADFKQLSLSEIDPYLYVHRDTHALTHWLRVAAGLDSMILGEPQILGQIKRSVQLAQEQKALSNQLGWIIDQVFAAAKRVRNETQVGAQAVSLSYAAAKLVTQIFDDLPSRTLLVVAAGEMNRLVATHIAGLGVGRVIICNRNPERAEALAVELRRAGHLVEVRPLQELPQVLAEADIVSSCSGSMDVLIDKTMTLRALKHRRYQPMLMIDLAVPRDIDSTISRIDDVYLYSVDDLQHVIAGNIEQRRQAAVDAELLVSQLVVEMDRSFQVRQVGKDIQQYRAHTQDQVDKLLHESIAKLQQDNASPEDIIIELSRRLTQTLTHAPSKLMRKAAREGDSELLDFVVSGLQEAHRGRR
ncbi:MULTISPECIES: glutamyl-tRNA reductase [Psychrobacter]|uniref:Glutamyl-tRNA reductase n=1 Tax=Psychrobacter immobilis TaxID=498 RepID=A0A2V2A2R5_PSYIM|nr:MULTISPECIES: glutamyl-tRNA reductase [Psychrobacter]MCG3873120.1 glutamyl-tRNA reductase [Psychrobacter sp. Ps7]MDN5561317.1 glutamyl-tRNA reductase [Psychrobacter sp.]PWK12551.1 glutamyl-tRNA reductase [Psychrobacter immobilis]WLG13990.1 glutamyl-tRNA reductase [Psychrobacter cibarius]